MNTRTAWGLLLGLLLGAAHLSADILYSVTDLGTDGQGINNAGQVVGTSYFSGVFHASLYSNGQITDLGTLGGNYSFAYDINEAGQVTGYSDTSTSDGFSHAFLYSNGQMTDLGTLGGNYSGATGINNAGQVVGIAATSDGGTHAFLYSNGQMRDLGVGEAYDINNAGQVVGRGSNGHAFLYSNGQMTDLGTLGGNTSIATGVNEAGQVVGYSDTADGGLLYAHAFLYSNGQMMDLGVGERCRANAINNDGQVVGGCAERGGPPYPFLYRNGQIYALGNLVDPARGIYRFATDINDHGQIVAGGSLLTPIPEPSTLALLGVALLGLGAWVRVHKVKRSNERVFGTASRRVIE